MVARNDPHETLPYSSGQSAAVVHGSARLFTAARRCTIPPAFMPLTHIDKTVMSIQSAKADGAQPDAAESGEIEWYRADVAIVQYDGLNDAYTLQLASAGDDERREVEAGRVYVDGGRTFIGRSTVFGEALSVVVTEGPDGARNADVHLQGEVDA